MRHPHQLFSPGFAAGPATCRTLSGNMWRGHWSAISRDVARRETEIGLEVYQDVINETRAPEVPCREYDQLPAGRRRGTQVGCVADGEIVRTKSGSGQVAHPAFLKSAEFLLPVPQARGACDQGSVHAGRTHAAIRVQILVAGTQGEPVRVPGRGRDDDPDRQAEICLKAPDYGHLLVVLLAKHSRIRLDDIEKARHNGSDTVEVTGPECAAENDGEVGERRRKWY